MFHFHRLCTRTCYVCDCISQYNKYIIHIYIYKYIYCHIIMQGYIMHTCLRHDVPFVSGCVLHTHQKSKVPLVCRYDLNSYVPTSRWKSSKPMRSLLRSRPSRSLALLALAVASASALCNIFWKSPASIWQSLKSLERKTLFGSTLNLSLKKWMRKIRNLGRTLRRGKHQHIYKNQNNPK